MKILRLRAYYDPEVTASSQLEKDFQNGCIAAQITCEYYTPMPTRGVSDKIRAQYKTEKKQVSSDGLLIVNRFSMFREGRNPIARALRYVLVNIVQYIKGIHARDVDVIVTSSTPPTMGLISAMIKKSLSRKYKRQVRFIYDLQDVFPDSLVTTGMTHQGSLLWKLGRKIEDYTYRNADKIITISQSMKRNILEKGVPEEKIEVISNWIDMDSVHPVDRKGNRLVSEFGIDPNKFIVVYAGNFGAAQGADIVLKAAKQFADNKDIQFVVFGGGAYFDDAVRKAKSLNNVMIHDLMPIDRVSEVYSLGDVALITCKAGTGKAGMPSKTWSIMACNTPIIASFDTKSDLAEALKESGAGCCVKPGSVKALADAIQMAYNDWKFGQVNQTDLRSYALHTASKEICIQKYIDTFHSVVGNREDYT